ncbi:hypothetical protein R3W88_004216 [Solanum pinnatisectum]|uniref:CCHC-type domain-containing protein n=1 Tax=Solanum pinnatisectum TaxID=50273 RepID=A0AAV9K8M9_9SOLN|nr:hypothetical protein R3W88_004216 [Solanum pinnatisectum]
MARLRDFTRMNPPMFFGSKVNEDPQEFVEEVYKIVDAMGVTSIEKAELPQGGNRGGSSMERPTCAKCGKKHDWKCLAGMGVCYGCRKSGHQLKDCPTPTTNGSEGNQAPPSGSNSDAPKNNHFYTLQSQSDQEGSPDVVTGMLQVFFY